MSGGFAESGEEGKKLQAEVLKSAGGTVRIVGPNTLGIVNLSHNFNASFLCPLKGCLGLLCQGGNAINEVEYIARKKELGFTQIVDSGNQADVGICDFLEYIQADPQTKAILMYIEGFRENEGRRFLNLAKQITKTKPIVVIKVGATELGRRAVSSHTGSLAGEDAIYDAVFEQAGVIRVKNSSELIDVAEALLKLPRMKGNRFGILVDGGSHSTMSCDTAAKYGLELAPLSSETQKKLKEILFPHSPVSNPVDFAGAMDADVRVLSNAASLMLKDTNVDGLIVAGINFGGYSRWWGSSEEVVAGFTELPKKYGKPMILHNSVLSEENPALKTIADGGIPVFLDTERAVRCMAALVKYGTYLETVKAAGKPRAISKKARPKKVEQIIKGAKAAGRSSLFEIEARELLKGYGLPVPKSMLAKTKDEAIEVAEKMGYPVVAKIVSAEIIHKTEAGGVKIDLKDKLAVEKAFNEITANAKKYNKGLKIEGVMISPMMPASTEIIIGMMHDAQFGPVIMFGLGGIFVEVLKDVAFGLIPVETNDACRMLREIRGWPVLEGVRGEAKDIKAIVDIILKISKLTIENGEISELDLNPVFVYEQGAKIIDVRIIL